MGQTRRSHIDALLLLGEPEAVAAVAHAEELTTEQAERAWWAYPSTEHARSMLSRESVVSASIGRELARYLIEHLPFESDSEQQLATIEAVLQPTLIEDAVVEQLWHKAQRNTTYMLGFMRALLGGSPQLANAISFETRVHEAAQNGYAQGKSHHETMLQQLVTPSGQMFIEAARIVLKKPADQFVVNSWLDTVADYFKDVRPSGIESGEYDHNRASVEKWMINSAVALLDSHESRPGAARVHDKVAAMLVLSLLSYESVRPYFSRSTATGAQMRRQLGPLLAKIDRDIEILSICI
jgi:hypothetical protein